MLIPAEVSEKLAKDWEEINGSGGDNKREKN